MSQVQDFPTLPLGECDEHLEGREGFLHYVVRRPRDTRKFPLFDLPYELRQMIFWQSIAVFRSPCPKKVHETMLRATWKDKPSPLLSTSRQIREEVINLLKHQELFTLRVTTFGVAFDKFSLSCMIAQGRKKSYEGLPGLQIGIWPISNDESRIVEMVYLYEQIHKLRNDLFDLEIDGIPQLSISFLESEMAQWSEGGEARNVLSDYDWKHRYDIELILDSFELLTNVGKTRIELPPTLRQEECFINYATATVRTMDSAKWMPWDILEDVFAKDDEFDLVYGESFLNAVEDIAEGFILAIEHDADDQCDIYYRLLYKWWYEDRYGPYEGGHRRVEDFLNYDLSRCRSPYDYSGDDLLF